MATIGFKEIKKYFEKAIDDGSLGRAYLFYGQEMIGKKTFALEIAGKINTQDAAGTGTLILAADEQGEAGLIGIDAIRRAKHFLSATPFNAERNILIIDDSHRLTEEAQNALLKILEEPPAKSVIFLIAATADTLLTTVRSRCLPVYFASHGRKEMLAVLDQADLNAGQKKFLADYANGRIGLVMRLIADKKLDQVKEHVSQLAYLIKADVRKRLEWSEKYSQQDKSFLESMFLSWLLYMRSTSNRGVLKNAFNVLEILQTSRQGQYNFQLTLDAFVVSL